MPPAFFKLLSFGLATASLTVATPLQQRAVSYTDPSLAGGSMLDSSAGLGEPLNVSAPCPRACLFGLVLHSHHQLRSSFLVSLRHRSSALRE
jgi:hypothetical protein